MDEKVKNALEAEDSGLERTALVTGKKSEHPLSTAHVQYTLHYCTRWDCFCYKKESGYPVYTHCTTVPGNTADSLASAWCSTSL
jgi:hypothetical protein